MMKYCKRFAPWVFMGITQHTLAAIYYVSPQGSDANPGTMDLPFASITQARDTLRGRDPSVMEPITVYLREGTYALDEPLIFTAEDSGSGSAPITYAAYPEERVIISGGARLELSWRPYRDGILQAETPPGLTIDQLFVNDIREPMARYPNFDADARPYHGAAADAFSPERAANWADPTGGYIHAMHRAHWGGYHYLITGKKTNDEVTYEGGWQNNRQMGMHKEHRFVENIFEELDAPGEWFHNPRTQTLYYFPRPNLNLGQARFDTARLRHLVELRGHADATVHHLHLRGFTFRHAARTFMDTREPLLRSDWTIYRGGAMVLEGAEDCRITDCEFDQVGGNAIFVNNYNRRIVIRRTHIHGAGASGVCFVGDPDSVRNPLFEYHQQQAYPDIDRNPGPKTNQYPEDCIVDDCLIHEIGVVEKQATGVQISMSRNITVRQCSIYDVGRAGINISEGTFGGHLIEFCDVFDTVRETGDHGSFNSWGRDRFWHLKQAPGEALPQLALLDAATTIIRNSRWRCDHGWDVDLDDGSSSYTIYNNLFLGGGLKLREGFHRQVRNNIAINNTLHPHVWYSDSMDRVTGNIWMGAYRPAGGMPKGHWGKEIDRNLFTTEADRVAFAAHGCDANSIVGDPMFADPSAGNYQVLPGSPALQLGFINFPMDRFGVQKPELKAIARTPEFPIPTIQAAKPRMPSDAEGQWLGAKVAALQGQEFSAFGINQEDGGVRLVDVPPTSRAGIAGLISGDVILTIDRKPAKSISTLRPATKAGKALTIEYVRDQQKHSLTIK